MKSRNLRDRAAVSTLAVGALLAVGVLSDQSLAQLTDLQPGRNFVSSVNFGTGRTTAIDAGDCDDDGDLDVIVANGGQGSAQQNRIYINQGGLQGGVLGVFADETASRLAGVTLDTSWDVEFVDFDADGDLDVCVANAGGPSVGQPTRFYTNLGGAQLGTAGFFQESTDTQWGTLVSVPLADQVYGSNVGPFREFSCDCEFGDLDDDGDADLFHSSYGPNVNGTRDSRLFLNEGAGIFHELWPWANPAADIKTHTSDIDLVDLDGDFDLDVFLSGGNTQGRSYLNNLRNPLSESPFHDVTQPAILDQGAAQMGSHSLSSDYSDLDGDGDFDIWLTNYNSNLERILANRGVVDGTYQFTQMNAWIVGDPNMDEHEADVIDYDADGDIDVFVANFSGANWIYQSGVAQGLLDFQGYFHRTGFTPPSPSLAAAFWETPQLNNGNTTMDVDMADIDNDGDDDLLVANDANQQNFLNTNVLGVPDVHAPTFYRLTEQGDKANGSETVIHAQIRDNASYYVMQFYDAQLVYSVDGGSPVSVVMFAQGSMQYRGVIPAQTDALIEYHVEVTDRAGNTGVSATHSFAQGNVAGDPWIDIGFALAGVSGNPLLVGTGPLSTGSAGTLSLSNAAPSALSTLFVSLASTPVPFKGGTLATVPLALSLPIFTTPSGTIPLSWAAWPAGLSGAQIYFQYAIQDAAAVAGVALSNALNGAVP